MCALLGKPHTSLKHRTLTQQLREKKTKEKERGSKIEDPVYMLAQTEERKNGSMSKEREKEKHTTTTNSCFNIFNSMLENRSFAMLFTHS